MAFHAKFAGRTPWLLRILHVNKFDVIVRPLKDTSLRKLSSAEGKILKQNYQRIADSKNQRMSVKSKNNNNSKSYGTSWAYLQVIGSGAKGAPNTLYLFTANKRYLFNCGEGTLRLATEHKIKLSQLNDIFITGKTWRNIGGLPGLSLSLQDIGVPEISLHGPKGLDEIYDATKRFVILNDIDVKMSKCSEDFVDDAMTVKYVILRPPETDENQKPAKKPKLENSVDQQFEEFGRDETMYYGTAEMKRGGNTRNLKSVLEKSVTTKTELEEQQYPSNCYVAYICKIHGKLGKLDLSKCVEKGVKPGPILGQLKAGLDVVLPDGTVVHSKDVKSPDEPGSVFIVLEVPDISYLKESSFESYFDNGSNARDNIPKVVVHYTPQHVLQHTRYQEFMSKFGAGTRHVCAGAAGRGARGGPACLGSEAVHRLQHKLHLLDPNIFPLLSDESIPALWDTCPEIKDINSPVIQKELELLKNKFQTENGDGAHEASDSDVINTVEGRTLTIFHLTRKELLDRSAELKLDVQKYITEATNEEGFVNCLEEFHQSIEKVRCAQTNDIDEYPKVVFLGTGSCLPSKSRNTSAILLHINKDSSMLLDCGESTITQLVRFYGPKGVDAVLKTLKAIYISHLHADHHMGLIGVLQAWDAATADGDLSARPPLFLLAPGQIVTWLSTYNRLFETIRHLYTLMPNQNLLVNAPEKMSTQQPSPAFLAALGVSRVDTCRVAHCPNAFGVAVHVGQHKITYSGDTIPCQELIKLGENSTLLIHEATLEDELKKDARIKMHSTTSQAIEVGKCMNAKYTILTHFSQRYSRVPKLNSTILNNNHNIGIAFDNMQVTMKDLELLPYMYAPLQLMFADHYELLEQRTKLRETKEKRRHSPTRLANVSKRQYTTNTNQNSTTAEDVVETN